MDDDAKKLNQDKYKTKIHEEIDDGKELIKEEKKSIEKIETDKVVESKTEKKDIFSTSIKEDKIDNEKTSLYNTDIPQNHNKFIPSNKGVKSDSPSLFDEEKGKKKTVDTDPGALNTDTYNASNFKTNTIETNTSTKPSEPSSKNRKVLWYSLGGGVLVLILVFSALYFLNIVGVPVEEKEAWNAATHYNTEYYYQKYLKDYPNGRYTGDASENINSLVSGEEYKSVNLSELENTSFMGKINYGENKDNSTIMRLSIGTMTMQDDRNKAIFDGTINLGPIDQRKDLLGEFYKEDNSIVFLEKGSDPSSFDISKGRVYEKNGKIFIESIDANQYWNIDKK